MIAAILLDCNLQLARQLVENFQLLRDRHCLQINIPLVGKPFEKTLFSEIYELIQNAALLTG